MRNVVSKASQKNALVVAKCEIERLARLMLSKQSKLSSVHLYLMFFVSHEEQSASEIYEKSGLQLQDTLRPRIIDFLKDEACFIDVRKQKYSKRDESARVHNLFTLSEKIITVNSESKAACSLFVLKSLKCVIGLTATPITRYHQTFQDLTN